MSNITPSNQNVYNNQIKQDVKLIISNDIQVKPGSIIIVRQNGIQTKYKNTGKPIIYSAHQELMMEIFNETA